MTLALSLGDVTGVGPEVTAKALDRVWDESDTCFLICGDPDAWRSNLARHAPRLVAVPTQRWEPGQPLASRLSLHAGSLPLPPRLPTADPLAGRAALHSVQLAAEACLKQGFAGMVTAPLSKETVVASGHSGFTGQTEFLAGIAGTRRFAMMLLGQDDRGRWLRVALVTTHLPLRKVADAIQPAAVRQAIDLAAESCRRLRLPRSRVGVCGLNPHAGEGGLLGQEEQRVIAPVIQSARAEGLDVHGPFAADTLFHRALHGHFDAVVAQYHDQGLGPLKLVAFDNGVNWTLGLPFVRTSPDHGTAFDIAGKGMADPSSMASAIRLALQVAGPITR